MLACGILTQKLGNLRRKPDYHLALPSACGDLPQPGLTLSRGYLIHLLTREAIRDWYTTLTLPHRGRKGDNKKSRLTPSGLIEQLTGGQKPTSCHQGRHGMDGECKIYMHGGSVINFFRSL